LQASPPYDDKLLFQQIAEGDEGAFTELYHIYIPQLLPFVTAVVRSDAVADEVIQEVFLRLWIGRDKLPAIIEPRAWIFRIASNICFTHLKKSFKEKKYIDSLAGKNELEEDEVQEKTQANELVSLIRQAIHQLPAQRKKIYRMSREAGMTIPEIANELGLSASTVKNTLVTSLQFIREFLRQKGYEVPIIIISLLVFKK